MRIVLCIFALGLACAFVAPVARAVESCSVDGRHINLNNGASTAGLTGTVICAEDGRTTREIPYVAGKRNGTEKRFGRVLARDEVVHTDYRDDRRHGWRRVFDPSGRLVTEDEYRDDRELGIGRSFHPNGKVRREVVRTGEQRTTFVHEYDDTGRLARVTCGTQTSMPIGRGECRYNDFTDTLRTFHPDGSPREVLPMKGGLIDGLAETFAASGAPQRREALAGGVLHGMSQVYADGGWVLEDATFVRGIADGPARRWYDRDRLAVEWRYAGGTLVSERVRYQNGELRAETSRADGRIDAKGFHDNGKPSFAGTYVDPASATRSDPRLATFFGVPRLRNVQEATEWGATAFWSSRLQAVGPQRTFFETGAPRSETTFENGRRNGPARDWHPNGRLAAEGVFANGRLVARKTWDENGVLTADEEIFEDGSRRRR